MEYIYIYNAVNDVSFKFWFIMYKAQKTIITAKNRYKHCESWQFKNNFISNNPGKGRGRLVE